MYENIDLYIIINLHCHDLWNRSPIQLINCTYHRSVCCSSSPKIYLYIKYQISEIGVIISDLYD